MLIESVCVILLFGRYSELYVFQATYIFTTHLQKKSLHPQKIMELGMDLVSVAVEMKAEATAVRLQEEVLSHCFFGGLGLGVWSLMCTSVGLANSHTHVPLDSQVLTARNHEDFSINRQR